MLAIPAASGNPKGVSCGKKGMSRRKLLCRADGKASILSKQQMAQANQEEIAIKAGVSLLQPTILSW